MAIILKSIRCNSNKYILTEKNHYLIWAIKLKKDSYIQINFDENRNLPLVFHAKYALPRQMYSQVPKQPNTKGNLYSCSKKTPTNKLFFRKAKEHL